MVIVKEVIALDGGRWKDEGERMKALTSNIEFILPPSAFIIPPSIVVLTS